MSAHFVLHPSAVSFVHAPDKPALIRTIARSFADTYELDAGIVEQALLEREALGSTGFGRRVALPHARVNGLTQPIAAIIRAKEPVDYGAADGRPVDFAFGLLSPADCGVTHLHALAAISRGMRDQNVLQAMRTAETPDALFALFSNVSDRDAA